MRLIFGVGLLLPHYLALRRFTAGAAANAAAIRFASSLVSLGPTFVKLGQILSTRPDVIPKAYVAALASLQEHGPEVPSVVVAATIRGELGKPIEELFATFEHKPVAKPE